MAKVMSDEDHAKLVTLLEAMIPKVAALEHEIVAYQIAKDNLELRYRDAEYPNCMSEDEHSVREPAWVY